MLYKEIITVCSEIHARHIHVICRQKVEFVNVKTCRYNKRSQGFKNLTFVCTGKAIPLQAWTGPEDSRRLRFPDFKTIGT
jgi:hypothetical protein